MTVARTWALTLGLTFIINRDRHRDSWTVNKRYVCASVKFHERESAKDLLKRKRKNMLVTVFVIAAYVLFCFFNVSKICWT